METNSPEIRIVSAPYRDWPRVGELWVCDPLGLVFVKGSDEDGCLVQSPGDRRSFLLPGRALICRVVRIEGIIWLQVAPVHSENLMHLDFARACIGAGFEWPDGQLQAAKEGA